MHQTGKKWINRTLSLCLTIMLMLSIFPMAAYAVEDNDMSEANEQESQNTEAVMQEKESSSEDTESPASENNEAESPDVESSTSENIKSSSPVIEPASLADGYNVTDDSSGSSYGTFSTLLEAVNACPDYVNCTITVNGNDTDMGTRVTISANKRITLTSAAGNNYTITQINTGTITNSQRHFYVQGELTLKNITLSGNGSSDANSNGGIYVYFGTLNMESGTVIKDCIDTYGGGVYANNSNITILEGIISDNTATLLGGGVSAKASTITMKGGIISDNAAKYGGGVSANASTITMKGGIISDNTTQYGGGNGGGMYLTNDCIFTMSDGAISGNTAVVRGGGIFADNCTIKMSGGAISRNTARNDSSIGIGGGVSLRNNATFTISDGTISDNTAQYSGGGVYIDNSTLAISGGAISGNTARYGGGVYDYQGAVTMSDGTISGNTAQYGAGVSAGGIFSMSGGTISGNTAQYRGGGVTVGIGTFTMSGGAISGNAAQSGGGIYTYDYSYADPAVITAYSNITIYGTATVAGNTAETTYTPPSNASDFTNRVTNPFDGSLLDNNNINYLVIFDISYNANGGTGSYSDTGIEPGATYEVKSIADTGISYEGFTFTGWNTQADGNGISYAAENTFTVSGDVTLYAQWKADSANIKGNDDSTVQTVAAKSSSPKTGDDTNILIPVLLLVSSLGGIIITLWNCKRNRSRGMN